MFALPLISEDHRTLAKAKALRIWHLTAFLLLRFRKTNSRIGREIVTILRFSVSVLSPGLVRLHGCTKLRHSIFVQPRAHRNVSLEVLHLGGTCAS